jgi:HEAT repeat protein
VCEAIANGSGSYGNRLDAEMIPPLLELIGSGNAELRAAAARALAEFPGPEVPQGLAAIARQAEAPMTKRLAAIDALAPNIYRRDVVEQLIGLWEDASPELGGRVFAALEPASSEPIGPNPEKWRSWWSEKAQLSEEEWLADQVRMYRDRLRTVKSDFDAFRDRWKRQVGDVTAKLRDFQREVFRSLPGGERDLRLVEWLNDPQDEVKGTALSIIKARIADEGKRPEGDVLNTVLRLLKEGSSTVRREILTLLQNLSDPAITKAVLAQLEEEKDPPTREAVFRAAGKLKLTDAFPALLHEIANPDANLECVREAAIALGQIADHPALAERLRDAVRPLLDRYQAAPAAEVALRGGLLTAMAGVGDSTFAPQFLEAVESEDPLLLRPAIRGLRVIGERSKLSRLRRHTAHPNALVRLEAIEAVGQLGREDVDWECVLSRLNPAVETNELARETAWRAFREMLRNQPIRERIRVAALLRDVPDREAEYLTELASILSGGKEPAPELEMVRDRLANLLVTQGKFVDALPHLRELFALRCQRNDPARLDAGLRLLDATLRTPVYTDTVELTGQLLKACGTDEYVTTRIVETIAQYLDSPETVADPGRTAMTLEEWQSHPQPALEPQLGRLLERVRLRLESAEKAPRPNAQP